jgi:enediyne biosynthesis protein CalE5
MPTVAELKEQQLFQWQATAHSWDEQHERLERETSVVTDWLCRAACLVPGIRVLDLACGSGHPALNEAQLVRPGGSVLATDFSLEMVEATRRRAKEAGIDNLEVRLADAEYTGLPDDSFNAVTMRFGLMFCPQPQRAAAEIRRVLRPGCRFALAVWDEPRKSPAQTVLADTFARFGGTPSDQQKGGPGLLALSAPGKLKGVLDAAGFIGLEIESVPMLWEYSSFEDFWQARALRYAPVGALVSRGDAVEIDRFKTGLFEMVQPYVSGGAIRITATALCASGSK